MKKVQYRQYISLLVIASIVFSSFGFLATPHQVNAENFSGFTLFGGKVYSATYCTCTPGCWKKLIIGPTGSGYYMWCPWTATYAYWYIWPIAWQLGKATVYMTCMQIAGKSCRSDGGGRVEFMLGTSVAL